MDLQKEWTILIFANGNNELEPEMANIFLDIENNVDILKNVNVVLQLSRAPLEEIKILRPQYLFLGNEPHWENTRRFYYNHDHFELVETLGNINMADAMELYRFIIWAAANYPAKRYMLAFGGHVYQFVGLLADYSQDKPYIAGFPQLAFAIEKACREQKINIDILVLDTCYSSTFEIIYEFGKNQENLIKYLFTYVGQAPMAGFIYSKILNRVENSCTLSTEAILKALAEDLINNSIGLIAYKLNYKLVALYKQLFNDIAYSYLLSKHTLKQNFQPYQILAIEEKSYPWSVFLSYLAKTIPLSIVKVIDNNEERKHLLPIHVLYKEIPDDEHKDAYLKLSFVKDNYWYHLITNTPICQPVITPSQSMEPIEMSKSLLHTMISTSNCLLSAAEIRGIINSIMKVKRWNL